jgi:hypothetical protein
MVMKFLDQLPNYLREVLGVRNVPLAFIIQETVEAPDHLPPLLTEQNNSKPWSDTHISMMGELIAYTPHSGPGYEADNAQLCNILSTQLASSSAIASITQYQRRRNGRQAYFDLVTHFMGSAK